MLMRCVIKHLQKEDGKGVNEMCAIMDELRKEAIIENNLEHIKKIMLIYDVTAKKAMKDLDICEEDYPMYLKLLGLKE